MKVIVATNNQNKLKEILKIVNDPSFEFYTLKDLNLNSDPEETGKTFVENATIKAESALEAANNAGLKDFAVVADDSGLCVDALDGAPGVFSARFAEVEGKKCTYSDNNNKLLSMLGNVDDDNRTAYFETAVVLILPDGKRIISTGKVEGKIARAEKGSNGFGYDPVFYSNEYPSKTFAELTAEEKDAISHRSRAFCDMIQRTRPWLNG